MSCFLSVRFQTLLRALVAILHASQPMMVLEVSRLNSRSRRMLNLSEVSYQLRYAEENHRSERNPWSIRQTGIYHHHKPRQNQDLFIILNPYAWSYCTLEERLIQMTTSKKASRALFDNPYLLHVLPVASYMDNWRWYFRFLGKRFLKLVSPTPWKS